MDLKEKVKSLPSSPGVYLMKNSENLIIYVGKSKNLKNRVSSYFVNSKSHSPKVVDLVKNIKSFEYILTDTEFEAFMLECKLIKELKPYYNKKMKSPLSYIYIRINMNEKHPHIEIINEPHEDDKSCCFGPYTSKNTVERGLEGIKEFYRILCSNNVKKTSTCLHYSLGLCIGMCQGGSKNDEYIAILQRIIELLCGKNKDLLKEMELKMNSASEAFDFETAAKYRDYIGAVSYLVDKAKVVKFSEQNKIIALLEHINKDTVKFFLIKGNAVIFSKKYPSKCLINNPKEIILQNILSCFNSGLMNDSVEIGKFEIDESQIIYSYLRNNKDTCRYVTIPLNFIRQSRYEKVKERLNKLFI